MALVRRGEDLLLGMDIYVRENSLFIASVSDDKTCQIYRVRVYRVCQTNEWDTTLTMYVKQTNRTLH